MPSGPKKRRASRRKKNEEKAQAKQTDVSEKLAKGGDLHEAKNTNEQVSDNFNAIQENNEVSLLDVTSNENILVSNDEPVLSKNAGCIMESVESGEISQGNESGGVETEKMTSAPETIFELVSNMKPEQILERYHNLCSDNDTTALDYDGPVAAIHVEELAENEAANVVKEVNESKRVIGEVADMFMDVSVVESVILNNDDKEMSKDATVMPQNSSCIIESVVSGESVVAPSNESIKEAENTNMIHDQSTLVAEGMNDAAQLVSDKDTVFVPPRVGSPVVLARQSSNEFLKENAASDENIGCFSAEIPSDSKEIQALPTGTVSPATENQIDEIPSHSKGMQALPKGTVPPATENQVAEIPSDSKGIKALPKGTVPPATENQVAEIQSDSKGIKALPKGTVPPATEIPSDSKEMLALPEGSVPPATENQVYFACPMHCKAECSFSQLLKGQLMEKVVQIKSAIHSLKEDLDKLDSISY